jgi:hypothetical protein
LLLLAAVDGIVAVLVLQICMISAVFETVARVATAFACSFNGAATVAVMSLLLCWM